MNDKIEIVKQWIEKADHDLGTAQVTYLYLPLYRDTIAFHCQQSAEKYLNGYLLFLEKISISEALYLNASELEEFAVEIRYPDTLIELTDIEIHQAFDIAKMIRAFVLTQMNLVIDYKDIQKE